MKNTIKSAISAILIISLVIYPEVVIKSTNDALSTCFNVLLPSLFPFFVLSRIFIKSGGADLLGRMLNPIMRPLFGISGSGASALILGIISGYPVGAKTAIDLYRQSALTKKETENLICFCNNSGPLFIIGALGIGMLSSKEAGVFLYIIHILSAITLGIILRFTLTDKSSPCKSASRNNIHHNIFTAAVEDSMVSMINVFAYVIFFAVMMDIAEISGAFTPIVKTLGNIGAESNIANPLICAVFEMTTGIKKLSAADSALSIKLILSSFMLGWSGLSIHFQTKSVLGDAEFSFAKYIAAKFAQGIIAAIYAFVGLRIVRFEKSVFLNSSYLLPDNNQAPLWLLAATVTIGLAYIIIQHRLRCNTRYSTQKQTSARGYKVS